jgi:protein-disulfide isomerase
MGRLFRTTSVAVFCFAALGLPVLSQEPDKELKKEIEALKEGQQQIRKELAEIKRLLSTQRKAPPPGPNVKDKVFDLGENPVKGEQTAKLTLVEFTDYQ